MLRIGLFASGAQGSGDPMQALRAELVSAARDGFASAWVPNILGIDALTALAAAGGAVSGIEYGTAVVATYPRHPVTLAQQALTTQLAVGGRLTLGIGLSHRVIIEDMYGMSFARPAAHMREYLDILLPLLKDGVADVSGSTLSAHLDIKIPRRSTPVLLAAMAPRMLELAGTRADGTVLWMTGPKTVESYIVPTLQRAAAGAGRPPPRVVCVTAVSVTSNVDELRRIAHEQWTGYTTLPTYRSMIDREGVASPADLLIAGDEDVVASKILTLEGIGVTDFVGMVYEGATPEEQHRTRRLLAQLARR